MAETYRKKPVEIQAEQWDGTEASGAKIAAWANADGDNVLYQAAGEFFDVEANETVAYDQVFAIHTLEGNMTVSPGDFVIQGVQGEFYPCKPGIFEQTYEKVSDA